MDSSKFSGGQHSGAALSDAYESVNQMADAWVTFVRNYGSGDILDTGGISTRWTDSKFPFYNIITFTEMSDRKQLDERLAASSSYMRGKRRAGFICLFEDLLSDEAKAGLPGSLAKAGLISAMPVAGMAADLTDMDLDLKPPVELTFTRIETTYQVLTYADINSRAYGWPAEICRDGFGKPDLWRDAHSYLGMVGGVAVSTAAAIPVNGMLYVTHVATIPESQARGYGTATVVKALSEAARATGIMRGILHAAKAGQPIYERIGYYKTATISLLALSDRRGNGDGATA